MENKTKIRSAVDFFADTVEQLTAPIFKLSENFCNVINPAKLNTAANKDATPAPEIKTDMFKSVADIIHPEPVNMNRIDPHSPGIL